MSFSHADFTFTHIAGPIIEGPWETALQIGQFPGIRGESHIHHGPFGRDLSCEYTMDGFDDADAANTALEALHDHVGESGTLEFGSVEYERCTFLGFQMQDRFVDGVTSKHVISGQLRWRQRGT